MNRDATETQNGQPVFGGRPEGQVLSGRYRIVREVGAGGMGMVYLAEDMELDNLLVAVKVLPTILANNKRAIDSLRHEAKTSLKLTHPDIVRLHTFQSDEAIKYLVMEYVDGGSLEDLLAQKGALSVEETLRIFTHVAAGLDHAHSQGVLHRDIKPANIMLTKAGTAKLTDFGIARQVKESMTHLTGKETSGTLLYMAPEQFRGGEPDPRTDIYSLAASIYECLCGHSPFWRGAIEYQIVHETPASLDKLNDAQNAAMLRALAKDPKDRQGTAGALLDELGATTPAHVSSGPARDRRGRDTLNFAKTQIGPITRARINRRRKKIIPVVLVCLLVMVAGLVGLWVYLRPAERPPTQGVAAAPPQATRAPAAAAGPATPAKVPFRIDAEPAGAMVTLTHDRLGTIAADKVGSTGLALNLEPGTYHVLVTAEGYRAVQQDVEVSESKSSWQVRLSEHRVELLIVSNPGVMVSARGPEGQSIALGQTDSQGQLRASPLREGDYQLTLTLADYASATADVSLQEGRAAQVKKLLEPLPGELTIGSGHGDTEIYEAGRWIGRVNEAIKLVAGEHELELRCKGFRTEQMSVTIPPNKPVLRESPALVAESGSLRITAVSSVAADNYLSRQSVQVRIDESQWREVTLPRIEEGLSCESHRVELKVPGYGPAAAQQVVIQDGHASQAGFTLTPEEAVVKIACDAAGAEVFDASGKRVGAVGETLRLSAFASHGLVVKAPRYKPAQVTVRVDRPGADEGVRQVVLEETRALVAGEAWTVPDLNMTMAYVEPGSFQMGASGRGVERDETPVHTVQISRGFWMGKCEVTNAQYQYFVKQSRYDGRGEGDSGYLRHYVDWGEYASPGDDYPVACVNWNNAVAFCRWLTERERKADRLPQGYQYRLPTEAEWEYAARGGAKSKGCKYSGSDNPEEVLWHRGNSARKTHPVGQKAPNELGLCDMSGNVWEWCHDWYAADYYRRTSPSDPAGPPSGRMHVFRGGSWYNNPGECRVTIRYARMVRPYQFGFRVVAAPVLE